MTTHDERWRALCRALDAARHPHRRDWGLPTDAPGLGALITAQHAAIGTAALSPLRDRLIEQCGYLAAWETWQQAANWIIERHRSIQPWELDWSAAEIIERARDSDTIDAAFAQILRRSGDIDTAFAAMVRQLADSDDQPPTAP